MADRSKRLTTSLDRARIVARRLAKLLPDRQSSPNQQPNVATSTIQNIYCQEYTDSTPSESFSTEMQVPRFFPLLLSAHRGDYGRFIENETGAKVSLDIGSSTNENTKIIRISAPKQEFVQQAEIFIRNELSTKKPQIYCIPSNKLGGVIGKGGETIKNLQDKSGCRIFVTQEGNEMAGPEKPINLFGSDAQINEAISCINEIVFGAKPGDFIKVFKIPDYACSGLVGKKAENIHFLQQSSNATIFLDNAVGSEDRRIYICGSQECISHARQLIQEQLGEDIQVISENCNYSTKQTQESPKESSFLEGSEIATVGITGSNVEISNINEGNYLYNSIESNYIANSYSTDNSSGALQNAAMSVNNPITQLDDTAIAAYYSYYGSLAVQYPEYASYYYALQQQLLQSHQNLSADIKSNQSNELNTSH